MTNEQDLYKNLQPFLNCIDYTVSKESYEVMYNSNYHMLVTSPLPKDLHNYYKSEDYISHTDGNKNLFEKLYQFIKNIAHKNKLSILNSQNPTSHNLLDIGAGTGDFLKFCSSKKWNVTGIEPSENARNLAKKKGIDLYKNLKGIESKKFDIITMWHVLEHVPNLNEYISQIKKLLTPNGTLIIAVPNFESYDANHYKEYWAAYDVPRHVWHFSKKAIHKLFNKHDMSVHEILPMKFDSYYVSLLSEKYKNGKMNFFKAFYIGSLSNWKAKGKNNYSSLIYILKNSKY